MAKGGHRRPVKRKRPVGKAAKNEPKNPKRVKDKRRQDQKNKTLLRQMRGMKWDEEEYSDEIEELDDFE